MMESFLDFYNKLYSTIPESYSKFGNFGEGVWDRMITEGLITSYPRDTVLKFLQNFNHQLFSIEIVPYSSNTNTIDIYVNTKTNQPTDPKGIKFVLDSKLKVYGYFVGRIGRMDHFGRVKLLIEAKFPVLLQPEELLDSPFYHITTKAHLDKIMKIGLTPRDSTTVFTHPGNRIYLIQTEHRQLLDTLKVQLSHSKMEVTNNNKWNINNMILMEVDITGLTLYVDPMFDKTTEYNAVFTQQNISPDKLIVVNH